MSSFIEKLQEELEICVQTVVEKAEKAEKTPTAKKLPFRKSIRRTQREKDRKKRRILQIQKDLETSAYLLSKGWHKGTYRCPDIPGEYMYRHPDESEKMTHTLRQAAKIQAKIDSNYKEIENEELITCDKCGRKFEDYGDIVFNKDSHKPLCCPCGWGVHPDQL